MRYAAILLTLIATPALAAARGTVPQPRTMPELSDIALFVVAVASVWFVRRAMRARFRKAAPKD